MSAVQRIVCVLLVLASLLMSTGTTSAQDGYHASAIIFGSGESPVVSGFAATIQFKNGKGGFLEITAQEQQAWFMFGKDFQSKSENESCSLYGSVGHLQGAPWAGPYASCKATFYRFGKVGLDGKKEKAVSLGAMAWPGFFLGREPSDWRNDGVKNSESLYVGWFEMAFLNVGPAQLFISHLNFLDTKTNWLPGVGFNKKLRKDFELNATSMWNSNASRPMFYIGGTWYPNNK